MADVKNIEFDFERVSEQYADQIESYKDAGRDEPAPTKRIFQSGATRSLLKDKLQISRFMSPVVLRRYCEYLQEHQVMEDGTIREPDNWKKGMDILTYADSGLRHAWAVWEHLIDNAPLSEKEYQDALCAVLFNFMGLLFEELILDDRIRQREAEIELLRERQ